MRRTRPPGTAAVLEWRVTHRLTRTLPMARCIIRCQGAAGAGRTQDLTQRHSHGTGEAPGFTSGELGLAPPLRLLLGTLLAEKDKAKPGQSLP